jgi:hypothetical protein
MTRASMGGWEAEEGRGIISEEGVASVFTVLIRSSVPVYNEGMAEGWR